jgi:hypothetical protein
MSEISKQLGLKEGSTFIIDKKGKLVIRSPPDKGIKSTNNENTGKDTEIIIENFIATVMDFIKYLAITSGKQSLPLAIEDYENQENNSNSLQKNVLKLVKARTDFKGITNDQMLSQILVVAAKEFSPQSSGMIYGKFKGKIDEKSTKKNAVLQIIHKYLTPRKKQKEEKGEVFTPIETVEEQLSHLPASIWKNPNLKWLDPANGIGNYPIVAFYKLDEGLRDWESNEDKRKKHIIENMLFMMELQGNNNRIAKNVFEKLNEGCKPNIATVNSLEITGAKLKAKGWPEKYDIIMGNPPYQKENKINDTARGGTNNNLYLEFINNSISLLKTNGYLLFIHPLNWRKIGSKIFTEFINRNIHYLKLNYGGDFFENVSVKTDYYVLKNSNSKNYKSIIEYIHNREIFTSNVILSNTLKFIPNIFNEHINSILNKINIYGKQYECIISSDCHKTRPHVKKGKTELFKYPLFCEHLFKIESLISSPFVSLLDAFKTFSKL